MTETNAVIDVLEISEYYISFADKYTQKISNSRYDFSEKIKNALLKWKHCGDILMDALNPVGIS